MRTVLIVSSGAVLLAASGLGHAARAAVSASTVNVVAAENVYGNIVVQIGGGRVRVTSILSDPNADPHLFEPGTRNGLAVAQARLVIQNGVGYDAFMGKLEQASPNSKRIIVTIADVLGVHSADANPHLWYDIPRLPQIAGAIAAGLEHADPSHAAAYRHGLTRFLATLAPLRHEIATIRHSFAGTPVAYTEPVPGYLLAAAGLRNIAPNAFTRAIEDGSDPTPGAVGAMQALISDHKIRVLLYNSQTVTPLTQQLRNQATKAGIPIVPVTETLPPGLTYQHWQLVQAQDLDNALHH